jgi:hypothetical protein
LNVSPTTTLVPRESGVYRCSTCRAATRKTVIRVTALGPILGYLWNGYWPDAAPGTSHRVADAGPLRRHVAGQPEGGRDPFPVVGVGVDRFRTSSASRYGLARRHSHRPLGSGLRLSKQGIWRTQMDDCVFPRGVGPQRLVIQAVDWLALRLDPIRKTPKIIRLTYV